MSSRLHSHVPTVASACVLLLLALAAVDAHAPGHAVAPAPDGGPTEEPVRVDTRHTAPLAVKAGASVPPTPEEWQKRPPCNRDVEEEHAGACYVRVARKPPCPPGLYEKKGACFVAVSRVPRPDTSVGE